MIRHTTFSFLIVQNCSTIRQFKKNKLYPYVSLLQPEDWDKPATIPDPEATQPEDWDTEMDGEWEPPQIDNPEYKGEWKPKQIDNPKYKVKCG